MTAPLPNHSVELLLASPGQKQVLARLMELYLYDFSEFGEGDVDENGLYDYPYLESYWTEPSRYPFLILVDGQLAGFVLVGPHSVRGVSGVQAIAEFFVMRKYRRKGVGRAAARAVFARLPGNWEVAETTENIDGQAFWRKIVGEFTGGSFREEFVKNDEWEGPVQVFSIPA